MKLLNQLLEVLSATPLPRRLDGKISLGIAHGLRTSLTFLPNSDDRESATYTGPQVAPKLII